MLSQECWYFSPPSFRRAVIGLAFLCILNWCIRYTDQVFIQTVQNGHSFLWQPVTIIFIIFLNYLRVSFILHFLHWILFWVMFARVKHILSRIILRKIWNEMFWQKSFRESLQGKNTHLYPSMCRKEKSSAFSCCCWN